MHTKAAKAPETSRANSIDSEVWYRAAINAQTHIHLLMLLANGTSEAPRLLHYTLGRSKTWQTPFNGFLVGCHRSSRPPSAY